MNLELQLHIHTYEVQRLYIIFWLSVRAHNCKNELLAMGCSTSKSAENPYFGESDSDRPDSKNINAIKIKS